MKLDPVNLDSSTLLDRIKAGQIYQVEGDDGSSFKGEPEFDPIRGVYFRSCHSNHRLHLGRVTTLHRLNYLKP